MTLESEMTSNDWPAFIGCIGSPYQPSQQLCVVVEMQVLVRIENSIPEAVRLLFALHYVLDLCYQRHKQHDLYFYEFIQKVLFELECKKVSPRITTFMNCIKRLM